MEDCEELSTPILEQMKALSLDGCAIKVTWYRQRVGSMVSFMLTSGPDISVAVGRLSHYMENPTSALWKALIVSFVTKQRHRQCEFFNSQKTKRLWSSWALRFWLGWLQCGQDVHKCICDIGCKGSGFLEIFRAICNNTFCIKSRVPCSLLCNTRISLTV